MQQPQQVHIETQGVVPIATLLLIFCMVVVFAMSCQHRMEFWSAHPSQMSWVQNSAAVQAVNIATWMRDGNFQRLLSQLAMASVAALTGWQLVANCYFTWVFGSTVEQKLGAGRYFLLVLLAMFVPYAIIAWNGIRTGDLSTYYFGPLFVLAALMGAGMVFPEEKEVKIWFKKTRGEIFNRGQAASASSKFKVNTQLLSCIFILYEAGLWFYCTKFTPEFQSFELFGAIAGVILGYGVAFFLVWSATGDLREGPVKLMCIRKYNDTLKLDVGHDAAVRTTAMALGLPEDRVKQWVQKQKGKMRIS